MPSAAAETSLTYFLTNHRREDKRKGPCHPINCQITNEAQVTDLLRVRHACEQLSFSPSLKLMSNEAGMWSKGLG